MIGFIVAGGVAAAAGIARMANRRGPRRLLRLVAALYTPSGVLADRLGPYTAPLDAAATRKAIAATKYPALPHA